MDNFQTDILSQMQNSSIFMMQDRNSFGLSNGCIHVSWTNAVTGDNVLLSFSERLSFCKHYYCIDINETVNPS